MYGFDPYVRRTGYTTRLAARLVSRLLDSAEGDGEHIIVCHNNAMAQFFINKVLDVLEVLDVEVDRSNVVRYTFYLPKTGGKFRVVTTAQVADGRLRGLNLASVEFDNGPEQYSGEQFSRLEREMEVVQLKINGINNKS